MDKTYIILIFYFNDRTSITFEGPNVSYYHDKEHNLIEVYISGRVYEIYTTNLKSIKKTVGF